MTLGYWQFHVSARVVLHYACINCIYSWYIDYVDGGANGMLRYNHQEMKQIRYPRQPINKMLIVAGFILFEHGNK